MNWLFLVTLWLLVSPAVAFLVAQMLRGGANFGVTKAREEEEARDLVRYAERMPVEAWREAAVRVRLYPCRARGCRAQLGAKEALAQGFFCGRHHAGRVLASWPERREARR